MGAGEFGAGPVPVPVPASVQPAASIANTAASTAPSVRIRLLVFIAVIDRASR